MLVSPGETDRAKPRPGHYRRRQTIVNRADVTRMADRKKRLRRWAQNSGKQNGAWGKVGLARWFTVVSSWVVD